MSLTDRTTAAQAADPEVAQYNLTEEDRQILALNKNEEFFSITPSNCGFGPQHHAGIPGVLAFAKAAHALLSKLRAPVADERAEWQAFRDWAWKKEGPAVGQMEGQTAVWAGWQERARRAALASAPVAGEAQITNSEAADFADKHGMYYDMDQEIAGNHARALLAAYAAPQASEAVPGCLLAAEHLGMTVDYTGLLGQARNALKRGENAPAMAEMLRQLAVHLTELGQRWYAGDAAVVDEFLQLYCIASDTRAALSAQLGAQKESRDGR